MQVRHSTYMPSQIFRRIMLPKCMWWQNHIQILAPQNLSSQIQQKHNPCLESNRAKTCFSSPGTFSLATRTSLPGYSLQALCQYPCWRYFFSKEYLLFWTRTSWGRWRTITVFVYKHHTLSLKEAWNTNVSWHLLTIFVTVELEDPFSPPSSEDKWVGVLWDQRYLRSHNLRYKVVWAEDCWISRQRVPVYAHSSLAKALFVWFLHSTVQTTIRP